MGLFVADYHVGSHSHALRFLFPDVARIDKIPVADVLLFIKLYSSSLQVFKKLQLVLQPAYKCERCIFKTCRKKKAQDCT